jgi:fluoride exporter
MDMTWIAVAVGGALGSMARHGVNVIANRVLRTPTPYATAIVNVSGCFVIGTLAGLVASGRLQMSTTMRTFVFVGILGGFTTFSSFGLDTLTLTRGGAHAMAVGNVAGQVSVGLLCVYLGYRLAL